MFITILFPLHSYNISHKIIPYRKATSLDVDCNYHVIAQCGFFLRNHRITESQNHRIIGVGRDLCGLSSPTPLPKQGHLQ